MARRTTAIKVFIASPGDVEKERLIVRKVVDKWNARNSDTRNILLHAVGWETHGTPMQGQAAQARINQTVLADCDLLIGIFHSRVGTPTNRYPSGAIEEVETHVNAGKKAMVYFSNAPLPEESDPDQVQLVRDLESKYISTSWVGSYENCYQFESLLFEHMTEMLNDDAYIDELRSSIAGTSTPEIMYSEPASEGMPLSSDELKMLKAAASSGSSISRSSEIGRPTIYAGILKYGEGDIQDFEKGLRILNKLESKGLVSDRSGREDVYSITHKGYGCIGRTRDAESGNFGLSADAVGLICAAGDPASPAGSIIHAMKSDGTGAFVVGDREFDVSTSKKHARWEAAVNELIDNGLVRNTGLGMYSFTHAGYQIAEIIFLASGDDKPIGGNRPGI